MSKYKRNIFDENQRRIDSFFKQTSSKSIQSEKKNSSLKMPGTKIREASDLSQMCSPTKKIKTELIIKKECDSNDDCILIDISQNDLLDEPSTSSAHNVPNMYTTPTKKTSSVLTCANLKQNTTTSPTKSPTKSPTNSFTPKKKSTKSPRKMKESVIDQEKMFKAIENINYAIERSCGPKEFDLEKIYASNSFICKYEGSLNTRECSHCDIKDVVLPQETYADYMYNIIAEVFNNEINFEYFDKHELDRIFSYLCLNPGAQILFTKLIRRTQAIQRIKTMSNVPESLKPFFDDLIRCGFVATDLSHISPEKMLNLLQADEIKQLSRNFKCVKPTKEKCIKELLDLIANTRSFFLASSPSTALLNEAKKMLGVCVYIPEDVQNLFDRIFTLFNPTEYPKEPITDIFKTLCDLDSKVVILYNMPCERYPVFRSREHLIDYVYSQVTYAKAVQANEAKDWDTVVDLGKIAFDHFQLILQGTVSSSQQETLPAHIQRFFPGHTWAKLISFCIPSLKKNKEFDTAELYLNTLINQSSYMQKCKGRWYDELSVIKSYHQKDHNSTIVLLTNGLSNNNLTIFDQTLLIQKLKKYSRRKTGLTDEYKQNAEEFLNKFETVIPPDTFASITITGDKIQSYEFNKGKSRWSHSTNQNMQIMNVEQVAMEHYFSHGFEDSLHCEGSLPVSLFVLLFWDELYTISVPGAYLSPYQTYPLDLFTSNFRLNREEQINAKIDFFTHINHASFVEYMTEKFTNCKHYRTLLPSNLYQSDEQFTSMIDCLGFSKVITICKKLLENYRLWRSGFPDLIVWNSSNKSYKIVEVKGPKDTLSVKQRMWMQYLQQSGVCTELCNVKGDFFSASFIHSKLPINKGAL